MVIGGMTFDIAGQIFVVVNYSDVRISLNGTIICNTYGGWHYDNFSFFIQPGDKVEQLYISNGSNGGTTIYYRQFL